MTVLMSLGIILAWTPYALICMWETYAASPESPWFSASAVLSAKLASVYNPLIYFFTSEKFQRHTLSLFGQALQEKRVVTIPSLNVRKWKITRHPSRPISENRDPIPGTAV